MRKAGINTRIELWEYVFSAETRAELKELVEIDESAIPRNNEDTAQVVESVRGAEIVISTWRAHAYTKEILDACPDLKLILYGAGSVKNFVTRELLEREVTVCSAVHLNAQPVAEFVLGIIFTSMKDVFAFDRALHEHGPEGWIRSRETFPGGYYKTSIGLLGYGRVSHALIQLLRPFDFRVYLNDPHLDRKATEALGVSHASQEWIMGHCDVISLHHGNTPENEGMINKDNLALLKPGARFINTARGQLVNEEDLAQRLKEGDIYAFLDVTSPEPPKAGHPFYSLPNCILTPHVAGSIGSEAQRMGDYCLRELKNWLAGEPLENPVDLNTVFERG